MPFKSKAQIRKLAILTQKGKFPEKTFMEWARNTKNTKKLPYKK